MSSSGNDGLGPFDVGDRAIVESGYRSNDDRNPNIANADLTHSTSRGANGNTQRGGFQARGRGATARGTRGGREACIDRNLNLGQMLLLHLFNLRTRIVARTFWMEGHGMLENGDGLSRIAGAVGVPLFMDQLTSSGNIISFARVCVDIQADSTFPEYFFISSEGESMEIQVEYQGVSTRCTHCNVFGHETKLCVSSQVSKLLSYNITSKTMSTCVERKLAGAK
ncbi:hypothetical protein ACSBR1_020377 [Camellia fascicularis]